MASKFYTLEEVASMLGLSEDKLKEMRENGDMHGYRDGASWKFKLNEVERVAGELGITLSSPESVAEAAGDDDDAFDLSDSFDSLLDLGTEGEDADFDLSDVESSSTVIGKDKADADASASASDILANELADSGSDISLASDDDDLQLAADSGELELGGSDLALDADDSLKLDDEGDLALEEDDDLVLGGSELSLESGSDLDSDSGLSLEDDSLELEGSDLQLSEDNVFSLDESAGPDDATEIKQDEEFLLSPSDELAGDESDSGSQVIALEDSEAAFGATDMIEDAEPAFLGEEGGDMQAQFVDMGDAAQAMSSVPVAAEPEEAPYSVMQVLGLFTVACLLMVTGIMMSDVILNMWSFNGEPSSTVLIELVTSSLGFQ